MVLDTVTPVWPTGPLYARTRTVTFVDRVPSHSGMRLHASAMDRHASRALLLSDIVSMPRTRRHRARAASPLAIQTTPHACARRIRVRLRASSIDASAPPSERPKTSISRRRS